MLQYMIALVIVLLPIHQMDVIGQVDSVQYGSIKDQSEEKEEENPAFRNVVATGENGKYIVVGQTRPAKGEYFYTVEDGHNELISSKREKADATHWTKFRIEVSIPKSSIPKNGSMIFYLFEKDNNGMMDNIYPVSLYQGKS